MDTGRKRRVAGSGASGYPVERLKQIEPALRAQHILALTLTKVFCPTGPGGGVDPTCKPGGGTGGAVALGKKDSNGLWEPGSVGRLAGVDTSKWKKTTKKAQWAMDRIAQMEDAAAKGDWKELKKLSSLKEGQWKKPDKYIQGILKAQKDLAAKEGQELPKIKLPKPTGPKLPKVDASHYKGSEKVGDDFDGRDKFKNMFGHEIKKEEVASAIAGLTGASDGSKVKIIWGGRDRDPTYVESSHDKEGWSSIRKIYKDDGKVVVENESFKIDPDKQGAGTGTKMLAQEVAWARQFGVSKIKTYGAKGEVYSAGYYAWPRMGYDGDIPWEHTVKPGFPEGAKRISDLMKTKEGRAWWKENGSGLHLEFDPTPGSYSSKVLEAYLKEKGISGILD